MVRKWFKTTRLMLLSIPSVDRGPLDPNNLMCYITEKVKAYMNSLGQKDSKNIVIFITW